MAMVAETRCEVATAMAATEARAEAARRGTGPHAASPAVGRARSVSVRSVVGKGAHAGASRLRLLSLGGTAGVRSGGA